MKKLEDEGVRYIRIVPKDDDANSQIGRGWKNIFKAKNREEA